MNRASFNLSIRMDVVRISMNQSYPKYIKEIGGGTDPEFQFIVSTSAVTSEIVPIESQMVWPLPEFILVALTNITV